MEDLETRLRRYRPVGPPDSLKACVLEATGPTLRPHSSSGWYQWAPAAAVFLLTVLFSWLTVQEHRLLAARLPPPPVRAEMWLPEEIQP